MRDPGNNIRGWDDAKTVDKESQQSHWDRWAGGGGKIQKKNYFQKFSEALPPFLVPKGDEVEVRFNVSIFNACYNAQE